MNSPFRLFCEDTFLQVFGNPNVPAKAVARHTSQPATELAATGASESPELDSDDESRDR